MKKNDLLIIFVTASLSLLIIFSFLRHIVSEYQLLIEENTGTKISWQLAVKTIYTQNFDGPEETHFKSNHLKQQLGEISIYHDADLPYLKTLTTNTMKKAKSLTLQYLGTYKQTKADLLLMSMEELRMFSDLTLIGGFYSEHEKLLAIGLYEADLTHIQKQNAAYTYEIEKTILHEYTHYAMERRLDYLQVNKSKVEIPAWFAEGVATFIEYQAESSPIDELEGTKVQFDMLQTQEQWQVARLDSNANIYFQSYQAINWLVQTYGERIIDTLLVETGNRESFKEALYYLTELEEETMHTIIFTLK